MDSLGLMNLTLILENSLGCKIAKSAQKAMTVAEYAALFPE